MKVRDLLGKKPLADYNHSSDEAGAGRQAICNLYSLLSRKIPDEDLDVEDPASLPAVARALEKLDVGFIGYDKRDLENGIKALRAFEAVAA